MKPNLLSAILATTVLTACAFPNRSSAPASQPPPIVFETSKVPTAPAVIGSTPSAGNPFGILMDISSPARQALLKQFGVAYFRPPTAPTVEDWTGLCAQCDLAMEMGLRLILTVRANGGGFAATHPPTDLDAYKRGLALILDKYPADVLVVENEENSILFYTGTPQDYAVELKAACEVAHSRDIPCANGGLVSAEVSLLVWDDYYEHGELSKACSFANRAFDQQTAQLLCNAKSLSDLPERIRTSLDKGKALLYVYKASGMDYMNFHWYIADGEALTETVSFLKKEVGLQVMTNEMGQQYEESPETVTRMLQQALDLGLTYIIWFNADGPKARALSNPDGSLRPNGQAFMNFLRNRSGTK